MLSDYATTGDGLIAALQVMAAMQTEGRSASDVCAMFEAMPQVLENIRFEASGADPLSAPAVRAAIDEAEARLAGTGRLLIRKSGTEPLIRVMAEGEDESLIRAVVSAISAEVAAA